MYPLITDHVLSLDLEFVENSAEVYATASDGYRFFARGVRLPAKDRRAVQT